MRRYLITWVYQIIESKGPLTVSQVQAELEKTKGKGERENKFCLTSSIELSQTLASSPLFEIVGRTRKASNAGNSGGSYVVAIWGVKSVEEVAKKWLSYKHRLRKKRCLPHVLAEEIDRLEAEGWQASNL